MDRPLRRGGLGVVPGVGVFVVVGIAGVLGGRLLGLPSPVIAGTFAGALTNTPALAAASERAGDTSGPTIGYSLAYLYGCLLYTSPSPRDRTRSRMPSSA